MAVDRIGNHLKQTKNGTVFTGRYNNLNELMGEVGSEFLRQVKWVPHFFRHAKSLRSRALGAFRGVSC